MPPAPRDPAERFWSKVDPDGPVPSSRPDLGPCWLWTGSSVDGYGRFTVRDGLIVNAHRWVYERYVDLVPAGLTVDHLCRTRACVRPSHLEAVSRGENVRRGEGIFARHGRQTQCIHGHPFDAANTYRDRRGRRSCRACRRKAA